MGPFMVTKSVGIQLTPRGCRPLVTKKYAMTIWLVVEPYPSEIYEFVSWDDYSQYMEK